jgi:hypothetical protein
MYTLYVKEAPRDGWVTVFQAVALLLYSAYFFSAAYTLTLVGRILAIRNDNRSEKQRTTPGPAKTATTGPEPPKEAS